MDLGTDHGILVNDTRGLRCVERLRDLRKYEGPLMVFLKTVTGVDNPTDGPSSRVKSGYLG